MNKAKGGHRKPDYIPSPEEIRRECERIRAEWSEAEREKRAVSRGRQPWKVPRTREREDRG